MKQLRVEEAFVKPFEFEGNNDFKEVDLFNVMAISSSRAFANCENLENVYFGLDITRIGNQTFAHCKNLTDVWFAITDKDKFIEIAEDAFYGCEQQITFHIFASAIDNKYLNNYARKHGFKVVGMI